MGLRSIFRRDTNRHSSQTTDTQQVSEPDRALLRQAATNGRPCVVFIPYNGLLQSMSVAKPQGMHGYFVVRLDLLYADGTHGVAYKEEFTLWNGAHTLLGSMPPTGRWCFFLGFDWSARIDSKYIDPAIFYQQGCAIMRLPLGPEHRFGYLEQAPELPVAFFPAGANIPLSGGSALVSTINYTLARIKCPAEESGDPSGVVQTYEDWEQFGFPSGGPELQELIDRSVDALLKEW